MLAVNGKTLNRFREVELATQAPRVHADGAARWCGAESSTSAPPRMRGEDIDRLLLWAGAVLHAPHRAMSIQRAIPPEGVFVAYFAYGSPATRYKLFAGRRIVEVDGRPTPDLDAFIAAVKGRENRSSVRLQDGDLERHGGRDHAQARPGLLADVRTATHARWLGAPGHSIAPPAPSVAQCLQLSCRAW